MIVGPTVRGPARRVLRRGDRVSVRCPVAGRTGLQGVVLRAAQEHLVRLDDGRELTFCPHELGLIRRGPSRVDVCRCPEGHPAHGGVA